MSGIVAALPFAPVPGAAATAGAVASPVWAPGSEPCSRSSWSSPWAAWWSPRCGCCAVARSACLAAPSAAGPRRRPTPPASGAERLLG